MIDWTHEAIEAAHRAMFQEPYDGTTAAMIGAGLDAAAAAQEMQAGNALREENARLREAVKNAYYEGWHDNASINDTAYKLHRYWEASEACAAIREGGKDEN